MEKISEMKNLVQTLNRYNDSYYNDNYNLVSDKEYDELYSKLQELENETGVILSQSPTINVGYEIRSELPKVRHNHPMLSLDKTKSIDELREFCEKSPAVIMQKLDGLSVTLMY